MTSFKLLHRLSPPTRWLLASLLVAAISPACRGRDNKSANPAEPATREPASTATTGPTDSAGTPMFEEGDNPPAVSLGGNAAPPETSAVDVSGTKLAALAWQTPIHKLPDPNSPVLGYLRAGAIVSASAKPIGHADCKGGWHTIAPFGAVCLAPNNATLDLNHELVRALSRRPDSSSTLPYMYGIVRRPGPLYGRLPTREQAAAAESGLEDRMKQWFDLDDHNGASFRADMWLRWKPNREVPDPAQLWASRANIDVPPFLEGGRLPPGNLHGLIKNKDDLVVGRMMRHQGFAFVDTVVFEGRRYGITTQLLAVPVDRVRPIEGSRFHGYEIPREIDFPFAIVRSKSAYSYEIDKGRFKKKDKLKRRTAIKLTGKQQFFQGVLHFETTDGLYLSDREVSRLDPARRMPKWGSNGERWLDINITKQTLVAYEGTKAVFATLVSTGEAGLGDPEKSKSTLRGIFRVDRKHVTATMDSDVVGEEFELNDIPYVQYFEGGYALHAAYWHNDFGTPRSHGCINVSPEDARRLFFWTEPKLPPGWHTVRRPLTGSVLFVHP